jgi:hypothetical protein
MLNDESKESVLLGQDEEKDIVEILSKHFGYSKQTIESHTRRQEIVKARDLIAYLLREYGDLSYPAIGRLLGDRDHTTIIYSYKKTKRKVEANSELKTELRDLIQEVQSIKKRRLHVQLHLIPEILATVGATNDEDNFQIFREIPERNSKMLELWREGLTLQNIANVFNISRERIRQIIIKTIRQMAMNESISKGIVMDSDVLVEEEMKKRKTLQESKKEKVIPITKEKRWSKYYTACRLCNTTAMPHVRHGLCERCSGRFRGERRKNIIERHLHNCDVCRIPHGEAVRKYGRDFYITKSQQVLCRGCFLKSTGKKLGNRIRRNKKRS